MQHISYPSNVSRENCSPRPCESNAMQKAADNSKRQQWYNKEKYCTFIYWAIVGLLVGSIALAPVIVLYIRKTGSTPNGITASAILRWNPVGITVAGVTGISSNTADKLNAPSHAMVDYRNILYVADRFNYRVQKYLSRSSMGITVCGNGTSGSTSTQLTVPFQVLVDSNENIRVVDRWNYRVQLFYNGSLSGVTIAGTGGLGSSNNQLNIPTGAAYDETLDSLYIADFSNNRIIRYTSRATSGIVVAGGNGYGINKNQLANPIRVYLDSFSNSLIIANSGTNNIVRWALGANNWTLLAGDMNGNSGNSAVTFNYPGDVTLDPMGNIYVVDRGNHRIQLFVNGQTEGITIAGVTGICGNDSSTLCTPFSIYLDNQLNLYVADSNNHRIQKFVRY